MNTSNSITTINPRIRVEYMQEYPTGRSKTFVSVDGYPPTEVVGNRGDLQVWSPYVDPETGMAKQTDVARLIPQGLTHDEAVEWLVGAAENNMAREAGYGEVAS